MNFLDLAEQTIRTLNQPLTANEVWEKAVELGLDKQLNTRGKTPWATLGARLYVDIRDNQESVFEAIGKRPARFWVRKLGKRTPDNLPAESAPDKPEKGAGAVKYTERDLCPALRFAVPKISRES